MTRASFEKRALFLLWKDDKMDAAERRKFVLARLRKEETVSANTLAEELHVSRQIIVGDIALLRALGHHIVSTSKGYQAGAEERSGEIAIIRCNHKRTQVMDELYAIVDNGGAVLDVTVDHNLYGRITGEMNLYSRYDVNCFLEKASDKNTKWLSGLVADGVHEHRILCADSDVRDRIIKALEEKGFLLGYE